ncbi:amidohydrolase [Pseudodesulfovibrio tunisiensis]|uniref:amidohydrolase n=1 Tax=Pseudodesulfovibrio tunisiensis TaxID=463192 RepID=UPI001FB416F2|nr:amidohydrolase [Pseudodesulfovibrio tunisiensis]
MTTTLIRNATILTMDKQRRIFQGGDVLVSQGKIAAIGGVPEDMIPEDAEIVDATGKLVLPGLINTHVHTSQQLERGLADDVNLLTWLHDRTWPFESALLEDDSYFSTLACGIELIKSGVTTFAEAGGQHVNGMARGVRKLGMRAALCQSSMDCGQGLPDGWVRPTQQVLDEQLGLHARWHGQADGRISVWLGLRTIFNCSDELIRRTMREAERLNTRVHMHVAEVREEVEFVRDTRGATTVRHLADIDALSPNLLAVHTVWLTPEEVALFAEHDVKVSHNPAAAMRVLGFAPVPDMIRAGVSVSIGTDGAPCNNRMDMFDEMYTTSLIHKGRYLDPTIITAETILEMATLHGARCMGMEREIGSLEPGKQADLILVDPRDAGSLPLHDPVTGLVTAMHSSNVDSTMCAGQWLMRDRKILTVDEDMLLDEIQERAEHIRERAGINLPSRYPVIKVR